MTATPCAQIVDAAVVETGGFSVFNDREKLALLRRLALERGLIVLTDSDGAGFVIRNYLRGRAAPGPGEAGLRPGRVRQGAAQAPRRTGGQAGGGGHAPGGASGGPADRRRNL
jgi:ribonuclease M5